MIFRLASSLFLVLLCSSFALADEERNAKLEKEKSLGEACSGTLYRSKKKDVPIYADSNLTSGVVYRLKLGEKVCYIGEKEKFAILDWRMFSAESKESSELAYAKLTDLWPPRKTSRSSQTSAPPGLVGLFYKAKSYLNRMRYGQPPDDALEPYRPVLGSYGREVQEEECKVDAKTSCPSVTQD